MQQTKKQLLKLLKQIFLPPYRLHEVPVIAGTLVLLLSILFTVLIIRTDTNLNSHAATANSVEPESGTLAGNTTIVTDINASGSKYIKFGTQAAPTPTPSGGGSVIFDSQSSSSVTGYGTSFSWSHTIGTGQNRLLVVGISDLSATAVTYNGIALTKLQSLAFSGSQSSEMWYLINPPSGTYNIVVTTGSSGPLQGGASSWFNVNQSNPFGTPVTQSGNLQNVTLTVPSASGEVVVDNFANANGADPITPTAGQTTLWNFNPGTCCFNAAGSYKSGSSSTTLSYSQQSAANYGWVAVAIKPASGSSPTLTPTPSGQNPCTNTTPPVGTTFTNMTFCDDFSGTSLNTNKWNSYMTSRAANGSPWNGDKLPAGDSAPNAGGNSASYYSPNQVIVNSGLNLLTAPSSAVSGYTYISGVITSYNHFQFAGGYVQITAKMPNDLAQGGWPAIWFLPGPGGPGGDRGEIDLFEGGFLNTDMGLPSSVPQNQVFASHYLGPNSNWVAAGYDTGVDMTSGYHTYGVEYKPGVSIKTFFDGHQVANWTNDINTDPYEIIINQQVASSATNGWHSQGPAGLSTYSISSVKVWQ